MSAESITSSISIRADDLQMLTRLCGAIRGAQTVEYGSLLVRRILMEPDSAADAIASLERLITALHPLSQGEVMQVLAAIATQDADESKRGVFVSPEEPAPPMEVTQESPATPEETDPAVVDDPLADHVQVSAAIRKEILAHGFPASIDMTTAQILQTMQMVASLVMVGRISDAQYVLTYLQTVKAYWAPGSTYIAEYASALASTISAAAACRTLR